jgi:hypothetical protein
MRLVTQSEYDCVRSLHRDVASSGYSGNNLSGDSRQWVADKPSLWTPNVPDTVGEAIVALSTGDRAKFNSHELAGHIRSMIFYPVIAPPRATYDELSGSGLLNEIGSPSVRAAVARAH